MNLFVMWKMNTHIIYVYISQVMNLFVVWKMNAHIIYVYIY